jgi:hypothetical protein
MAYTTINKPTDYFNTKLYTGNAGTQSITGVGFQPDMVWLKKRSASGSHYITDAVRGVGKALFPDATNAEYNYSDGVTAFGTDGWTVGNNGGMNGSSTTQVSWNWKAGTGQGSSNTDGSINTTYTSVNTTAGFSIIKYTGNGTSGATIGHGLGSTPAMIIVKNVLSTGGGGEHWAVRHKDVTAGWNLYLNLTNTKDDNSTVFTTTAPTSSVFSVGNNDRTNKSGDTYIAYCFSNRQGYSKIGAYTGSGNADGAFVYTGFKPAFVIIKRTDTTNNWYIHDNKRLGYNVSNSYLKANEDSAESATTDIDILSNGFKCRSTGNGHNNSSGTYIYMAFAEAPLVGSNGVTAKAR